MDRLERQHAATRWAAFAGLPLEAWPDDQRTAWCDAILSDDSAALDGASDLNLESAIALFAAALASGQ